MLAQPASNEPDEEAETQSTAEQLKQKAGQYNQRASDLREQLNNNPDGKSHEEALALQDQVTQLNADTQQLREDLNEAARSGEITGSDLTDALYDVDDDANRANNLRPEAARQVQYASPNGQNAREVAGAALDIASIYPPFRLARATRGIGTIGNGVKSAARRTDGIALRAEFKEGMNAKEFNRKINRVQNAINDGRANLSIPHNISDAERRAITRKYRRDLRKRIESFHSNDPIARDNALKRLRNSDIDHMLDLQLDGKNVRHNLKTLDSKVNQELGRQFSTQLPRGKRVPVTEINVKGLPEIP